MADIFTPLRTFPPPLKMDAATSKASPFPPAGDIPLHRNPPLAPSQEMAYRNKCIQLKRRLTEIETNNDATRKRIATEKERIAKMRLMRAILLNQLKEIMEKPGKSLTSEQLKELGIMEEDKEDSKPDAVHETLLDDNSDESEDEDLPEPSERPTRTRRQNNNYRESVMMPNSSNNNNNTTAATPNNNTTTTPRYQQSSLPNLLPANSFSPAAARDAPLTASFHVGSTPIAVASSAIDSPPQSHYGGGGQQYTSGDARYSQHSSPIQVHQNMYQDVPVTTASSNGVPSNRATRGSGSSPPPPPPPPLAQPVRPKAPVEQFRDHMRPQLVADHYPAEQVEDRIDAEWIKLSQENRGLWEQRYEEQMVEYQAQMDQYSQARRRERATAEAGGVVSGSGRAGRGFLP